MSTSVLLLAYKLETEDSYKSFFNDLVKSNSPKWHLSILVFNFEYSYSNRGITIQKINDKPTEITYMDYTEIDKVQLDNFVNIVLPENGWTKENYDFSLRNCQHFVHIILDFLEIDEPIPNYYVFAKHINLGIHKKNKEKPEDSSLKEPEKSDVKWTRNKMSAARSEPGMTRQAVPSVPIMIPPLCEFHRAHQARNLSWNDNEFLPSSVQHAPSVWQPQPHDSRIFQRLKNCLPELYTTTQHIRVHSVMPPQVECQHPWRTTGLECEWPIPVHGRIVRSGFKINVAPDSLTPYWPSFSNQGGSRDFHLYTRRGVDGCMKDCEFNNFHQQ